jgi:hypothetical protein
VQILKFFLNVQNIYVVVKSLIAWITSLVTLNLLNQESPLSGGKLFNEKHGANTTTFKLTFTTSAFK